MASAAGVAGVRATLDLGSKNFKCVQCREPDSARITRDSEVIHLDEKRPTRAIEELHQVAATRTERRQTVKVDCFRLADEPPTSYLASHNFVSLLPRDNVNSAVALKPLPYRLGRRCSQTELQETKPRSQYWREG